MFLAVFAICAVVVSVNGARVGNVAFSAMLSASRSFQFHEIVKFDDVKTNIGNAYNKDTGIFTAPKTGLYVFHFHAISTYNLGFWFSLCHNDVFLYKANGQSNGVYRSGGNSMALTVKSGETVYVKTHYQSSVDVGRGGGTTTFTGYLIAAEYDE